MFKRLAVVGLAAFLCAGLAQAQEEAPVKRPHYIAVVGFTNLRPGTDTDWIGEGAAETVTNKLAGVTGLVPVERSQLKKLIEEQKLQVAELSNPQTAARLGKLLGASRVVIGTYACEGDGVLFNVRVVDVHTTLVLNAATFTGTRAKIFDTLYQLAQAVVDSFEKKVVMVDARPVVTEVPRSERMELTEQDRQCLRDWGTTNLVAYEAFSRGNAATDPDARIGWYTKAIQGDPRYAWAYNNRGNASWGKGQDDRAIQDYDRALQIKPDDADAYHNRAVAYYFKKEFNKAWEDVRRCQALGGQVKPEFLKLLREASGRTE